MQDVDWDGGIKSLSERCTVQEELMKYTIDAYRGRKRERERERASERERVSMWW